MDPSPRAGARSRAVHLGVAVGVFVIVAVVRWITQSGLGGDDHWSLWTAATFLKGDLPFRDFVDPGDPLYWALSALAQWIAGYRVVGEIALGTLLVAAAFAVTFHLSWQASRSLWIAALLTALALLLVTITKVYSYPKIFVYPIGLWLCWRYVDTPTLARSILLAAGVVMAWGFRHDHGVYVGVGAAAAILATHWPEGPYQIVRAWARFGAALILLMAPYLLLIQVNEGIPQYIRARVDFARQLDEAGRTFSWFAVDSGAPPHWLRIDPPRAARVQVDWKPDVTADTRTALERQYSLTGGVHPKKRLYEYFLTDTSRENLAAILSDSRLVEKRGLNASYREAGGAKVLNDIVASERPPDDAPAGARAQLVLQWAANVPESDFAALERQYGLVDPTPDRNRWEYALGDVSTANLRAIVDDPHVSDTGLIDRTSYRPMEESTLVRLQRTLPLLRVSIAPRYWHGLNAAVFLYYLCFALPLIVVFMLALDGRRGTMRPGMPNARAKMFAAAVMIAVANLALLRKLGYLSDYAHINAVLGAWIAGEGLSRHPSRPARSWPIVIATGAGLVVAAFATITYISPMNTIAAAGFNDGIRGGWDKAVRTFRTAATSPPIDEYAPPGTTGDRGLLRYLYDCTRPTDRIWLLTETYTVPYYTERRIVGHIFWGMGFLATPEFQRRTIEQVETQDVPFVISFGGERPLSNLEAYDLVHDYAARRYTEVHSVKEDKADRGFSIWLLTDNRRPPSGTYEQFGLPCFK